ncbi:MAG: hypothetical protein N3G19_03375 [Candidatus Pacearchaeota archaeon]|nr:hypothetical protein [Candidatus Pacearchaeota archaeon]
MSKKNSKKNIVKKRKEKSKEKTKKRIAKKEEEKKLKEKIKENEEKLQLPREEFDFHLEATTTASKTPVLEMKSATKTLTKLEDSVGEIIVPEKTEKKKKEEKPYVPVHYGGEIRYVSKSEEDFKEKYEEKSFKKIRENIMLKRKLTTIEEREHKIEPVREMRFEEIVKYEKKYEKFRAEESNIGELKRNKNIKKNYETIHQNLRD